MRRSYTKISSAHCITKLGPLAVVLLAVIAGTIGCKGEVKDADEQDRGTLVVPPVPEPGGSSFGLTEEGAERSYDNGSMIIWDPDVSAEDIRLVAENSRDRRLVAADIRAYNEMHLWAVDDSLAQSRVDYEDVQQQIAQYKSDNPEGKERLAERQRPIVSAWFADRLAELRAADAISEEAQAHANQMFGAYCEAKIWEMATSSLLQLRYKRRPTPQQMCEPYYQAQGYFEYGEDAGPVCAPAAAGQSYFLCLWSFGVLKSPLIVDKMSNGTEYECNSARNRTDNDYPHRLAAIQAWVDSGLLQAVLQDNEVRRNFPYAKLFADTVVQGSAISKVRFLRGERATRYADFARCLYAFKRKFSEEESVIDDWHYAKPSTLMLIGETEAAAVASAPFKLLPPSGDPARDEQNFEILGAFITSYAKKRSQLPADIAAGSQAPVPFALGLNDSFFNFTIDRVFTLDERDEALFCAEPVFQEVCEIEETLVPEQLRAQERQLSEQIDQLQETLIANRSSAERKSLEERLFGILNDGKNIAGKPGVAKLVAGFSLKLVRSEGALHVAELKFQRGSTRLVGCVPIIEQGGAASCPETPLFLTGSAAELARVQIDRDDGGLVFDILLDDLEGLGFTPSPRGVVAGNFSDFSAEELSGQTLQLKIFPNQLGSLEIFTGDAKLLDSSGNTLFSGGNHGYHSGR